ncbi:MAG: hypothetical protein ACPG4Z_05175 [Chitinophagales bacterium]
MKSFFTILSICFISLGFAFNQKYTFEQYELNLMPDSTFTFYESSSITYDIVSGKYLYRNDSIILTTYKVNTETAIFCIATPSANKSIAMEYVQKEYISSFPSQLYLSTTYHENGNPKMERFYKDKMAKGDFEEYHWNKDQSLHYSTIYENWQMTEELIYFDENSFGIPFAKETKTWKDGLAHGKWYYYDYTEDMTSIKLIVVEIYKNGKLKKEKW